MEIIKISNGEKARELSSNIIDLINKYSECLTGFEVIGVIEAVKQECHHTFGGIKDE